MTESLLRPMEAPAANEAPPAHSPQRVLLDGRRPKLLDHRGHVLQVVAGHVDLFAVIVSDGRIERARQHLLRIEAGEIIPDLPEHAGPTGERLQVIAVGGLGTEALIVPRTGCDNPALVQAWIGKLAKVIAGPNPSWEMHEAEREGVVDMLPGEQRRGPARDITWVSVATGAARLMRHEPPYQAGSPLIPLASGMWIEAGEPRCSLVGGCVPTGRELWDALDRFHVCAVACIRDQLARNADREAQRLVLRTELDASQTFELFDRLSAISRPPIRQTRCLRPARSLRKRSTRPSFARRAEDRSSWRSMTSSRSPVRRGFASAKPSCGATGGCTMLARWWPGTARGAARWRSSARANAT
jgi:hypothetical protein